MPPKEAELLTQIAKLDAALDSLTAKVARRMLPLRSLLEL
jgi:hypothetical protein